MRKPTAFANLLAYVAWAFFAMPLAACSARADLPQEARYDYKRMILMVTWGEKEFQPHWSLAGTFNAPARRLRWVRVGGKLIDSGLPGLRPNLDIHAVVATDVAPVERDDLIEIVSSQQGSPNLDTQANTGVVTRIVCKGADRSCVRSVMSRLGHQGTEVIRTASRDEWSQVPRGLK